jgi:hypothetical protein
MEPTEIRARKGKLLEGLPVFVIWTLALSNPRLVLELLVCLHPQHLVLVPR